MGQFNPFVGAASGGGGTGTTNYQELTNKPKINGIQLNGNKTMVDLGVFYGASLNASINTSTYIMTLQLKDQLGNILGTSQTIDLPLETVVVGGRYDDQTKRVILTLQNGNTINFSVADLIDGLQAEITSENRLDADLINDTTSINKFVTETEKISWNNKVDQISGKGLSTNDYTTEEKNKLAAIEAQANKTVVDSTLNSSSTNPVQNRVVKEALDTKQASLTASQLATVNSGITSADVDQIETNKNNISSVREQANWNSNNGVKNICPYNSGATSTGEGTVWNNLPIDIPAGTYSVSFSTDSTASALVLFAADGATEVLRKTYSATTVNDTFTISVAAKYIRLYIGAPKTVSNFMIRSFGDDTFVPYALSNAELTAAAVELVDNGAKNKLSIGAPTTIPAGLTCVRNNDGTYTVSGSLSAANSISFNIGAIEGDLVLSGCPAGGGDNSYLLRITKSGSQVSGSVDTGNGSGVFTMEGAGYALNIRFAAGTYNGIIFKPMICTKAAWDISQEYQPYRPNTTDAVFGPGIEIIGTSDAHEDLDNYTELGVYFCRNSANAGYVDNKPVGGSGFRLTVENISDTNTFRQTFIKPTDPSKIYIRHYSTSTWSSWYVFEGTVVT